VGPSIICRKCRAYIEGFGCEVWMVRTDINPVPQRVMTQDSLPFNRGVLAFQCLAVRLHVVKRRTPRRIQHTHLPFSEKRLTHVGTQTGDSRKHPDLCTPPKLARNSPRCRTAMRSMYLHLKTVSIDGLCHEW
jgi:hypothetical protein